MSDLNDLNLDMEVGASFDEYEKPDNTFIPPPPGVYSFLRSTEKPLEWKPTKNNDIWSPVRFIIQGGDFANRNVFDSLSTFVGKFRKASSVQDFLAACEYDGAPSNGSRFTAQEIMDAVDQTFGPFDAYADWQGYCKDCGKVTIKNGKSFPKDAEGNPVHQAACPVCGAPLAATLRVKRYIVK
jgi:hypothetical protein